MQRDFILDGDTTTTGGTVHAIPQQFPVTYGADAKHGCFEGSPVYCPACKTTGVTKCIRPYRPHTAPDGKQINLDGDLCICNCPSPPRLVARTRGIYTMVFAPYEVADAHEWLGTATGGALSATKGTSGKFGRKFQFNDSITGKPLKNRRLIINNAGKTMHAKTDSNGIATIEVETESTISVHMIFSAPTGEIKYKI